MGLMGDLLENFNPNAIVELRAIFRGYRGRSIPTDQVVRSGHLRVKSEYYLRFQYTTEQSIRPRETPGSAFSVDGPDQQACHSLRKGVEYHNRRIRTIQVRMAINRIPLCVNLFP